MEKWKISNLNVVYQICFCTLRFRNEQCHVRETLITFLCILWILCFCFRMFVFNLILIGIVIIIKKACYSSYLFNIYVTSRKKSVTRVFITVLRIHQSNDNEIIIHLLLSTLPRRTTRPLSWTLWLPKYVRSLNQLELSWVRERISILNKEPCGAPFTEKWKELEQWQKCVCIS